MYPIHTKVIYGSFGVCTVADIRKETFFGEEKTYYILKPYDAGGSTYYVPLDRTDLTDKMKCLLTEEELHSLLQNFTYADSWISDPHQRTRRFKEILTTSDRNELIQLVMSIYFHKQSLLSIGKKPMVSDVSAMTKGEKMLCDEFSLVIDISPDEMIPYLMKNTDIAANNTSAN